MEADTLMKSFLLLAAAKISLISNQFRSVDTYLQKGGRFVFVVSDSDA